MIATCLIWHGGEAVSLRCQRGIIPDIHSMRKIRHLLFSLNSSCDPANGLVTPKDTSSFPVCCLVGDTAPWSRQKMLETGDVFNHVSFLTQSAIQAHEAAQTCLRVSQQFRGLHCFRLELFVVAMVGPPLSAPPHARNEKLTATTKILISITLVQRISCLCRLSGPSCPTFLGYNIVLG